MFEEDLDLWALMDKHVMNPPWELGRYKVPTETPTVRPTEASVRYWDSELGMEKVDGACNRAVAYRILGVSPTEQMDPRVKWITRVGNYFEEDATAILNAIKMLAGKSVRFTDPRFALPMSGEMDAVCTFIDSKGEKQLFVLDWKTTGGNYAGNTQILGNTKVIPMPKIPNLLQLMVYLYADPGLRFGKLMYIIRDRMERTEFTVRLQPYQNDLIANIKSVASTSSRSIVQGDVRPYPQYSIGKIKERISELAGYVAKNELPPPDFSIVYTDEQAKILASKGLLAETSLKKHLAKKELAGDFQCRYCNYRSRCKSDQDKNTTVLSNP